MLRRSLVTAALVAFAAGCPADGVSATSSSFKVALLTPGPTTDMGWNALARDGAQMIEKELGAKVAHVQEGNAAKFEDVLKGFALDGSSLVFAHGYEYQEACEKIGAKFPKTVFIVGSGKASFANGAPIKFRLDEAFYLGGILAAHLSKTKKLGCVGGMPIPPVKSGFDSFERAAKKIDKEITVTATYLDSWDDAAKGKEQALALAGAGCDVIIHNADHAGLGVFAAAKERSLLAIGSNRDQNDVEPGVVIASATADIARCMLEIAKEVKAGSFKPHDFDLDMKSGYVDLKLSPRATVPASVKEEIDAARKAIVAGTLDPSKD